MLSSAGLSLSPAHIPGWILHGPLEHGLQDVPGAVRGFELGLRGSGAFLHSVGAAANLEGSKGHLQDGYGALYRDYMMVPTKCFYGIHVRWSCQKCRHPGLLIGAARTQGPKSYDPCNIVANGPPRILTYTIMKHDTPRPPMFSNRQDKFELELVEHDFFDDLGFLLRPLVPWSRSGDSYGLPVRDWGLRPSDFETG